MGLLDNIDDPRTAGLLSFGLGLLNSRGSFGQALGQAGQQAMAHMQALKQAKAQDAERQQQTQMRDLQMQQSRLALQQAQEAMTRRQQMEAARNSFLDKVDPSVGPAMPIGVAEAMRAGMSADEIGMLSPVGKDAKPVVVGNSLFDPSSGKVLYTDPKESAPTEIGKLTAEMQKLPPSSPLRAVYAAAIRKATTHAPSAQTVLNVNTAKTLTAEMAGGLGKQLDAGLEGAKSANNTIATANTIREIVDSGKAIVGPAADKRIVLTRIGDMLGVAGKDAGERLSNTAQLVQSLAKTELDAAAAMRGQGQITESERAILRRAAGGDVNMSAPELVTLSGALEKTARARIKAHKKNVEALQSVDGAAPLIPFYNVDEAPAASNGRWSIRQK